MELTFKTTCQSIQIRWLRKQWIPKTQIELFKICLMGVLQCKELLQQGITVKELKVSKRIAVNKQVKINYRRLNNKQWTLRISSNSYLRIQKLVKEEVKANNNKLSLQKLIMVSFISSKMYNSLFLLLIIINHHQTFSNNNSNNNNSFKTLNSSNRWLLKFQRTKILLIYQMNKKQPWCKTIKSLVKRHYHLI